MRSRWAGIFDHVRREYAVISQWLWWDVEPIDKVDGDENLTIVIADHIIFDEQERFPPNGWLRTSPLKDGTLELYIRNQKYLLHFSWCG